MVELLTVMGIGTLLLAVGLPTAARLAAGSGVDGGARRVGGLLRLARQEAIARRHHIAVLFPTVNPDTGERLAFVAFRPCLVGAAAGSPFVGWIGDASWDFAPTGAVIAEVDQDDAPGSPPRPDLADNTISTVCGVPGFAAPLRAVVFKPSGRLGGSLQRYVTIVEGSMPADGTTPLVRNRDNWTNIGVNQHTGRIKYRRPGG